MAAAILNPPFAIHARRTGLRDMGAVVDWVGPYLGTVPYVLRSWAQVNSDVLVTYLQACIQGLRWSLDPANQAEAVALYADRLSLPGDIAAQMYALAADPAGGLTEDARFDAEGFENVLKLRAEFEGRTLSAPERYLDLSYYRRALAGL
jgi:ABC-type nitrate/sulfonate/bicarbonate transport system substrate-binding protein